MTRNKTHNFAGAVQNKNNTFSKTIPEKRGKYSLLLPIHVILNPIHSRLFPSTPPPRPKSSNSLPNSPTLPIPTLPTSRHEQHHTHTLSHNPPPPSIPTYIPPRPACPCFERIIQTKQNPAALQKGPHNPFPSPPQTLPHHSDSFSHRLPKLCCYKTQFRSMPHSLVIRRSALPR